MTNRTKKRRTTRKLVAFVIFISLVAVVIAIAYRFFKDESNPTSAASVDKYEQFESQISNEHQSDESSKEEQIADIVPEVVWGIDVSHWNVEQTDNPEFIPNLKAAGCQFVYIQIGKTVENSLKDYWEYAQGVAMACEEAELLYGFYYLTEADVESEMYMELWFITKFFKDTLSTLDLKYNKLPLVLDFETEGTEKVDHLKQLSLLVNHLHSEDIIPVIYSSESMLSRLEEALQNPNQEYWMANHALDDTGIAPGQMPATMRENQKIICWQYTDDTNLVFERGVDTNGQALDRDLMPYNVWAYYQELCN